MVDKTIYYKGGYKYQLHQSYTVYINIKPSRNIVSPKGFIALDTNGCLIIHQGYCWDGPSGPTIDTPDFMRPSLVHDALYQLMRENSLPRSRRKEVDLLLRQMCLEDGMSKIRAWWVYSAVRVGAERSSTHHGIRPIITAPAR